MKKLQIIYEHWTESNWSDDLYDGGKHYYDVELKLGEVYEIYHGPKVILTKIGSDYIKYRLSGTIFSKTLRLEEKEVIYDGGNSDARSSSKEYYSIYLTR